LPVGFFMCEKEQERDLEDARTGNLASSVRTIPITYVQFFVPGNM
jgi:hypothetical protein